MRVTVTGNRRTPELRLIKLTPTKLALVEIYPTLTAPFVPQATPKGVLIVGPTVEMVVVVRTREVSRPITTSSARRAALLILL